MRKIIIYFLILIIFVLGTSVYALNEEKIEEQKNTFEVNKFINDAGEYINEDFLNHDEINDLLSNAIKGNVNNKKVLSKITSLFGKEFKNTIGTLSSILVIIVIHSILKSVSENLNDQNISKLIYYVQYIMIVTLVMKNFTDIITQIKDAANNMVGFINILIPLLTSLMLFTGSITTTSMIQPVILFSVNFIGNLIQNILIPIVLVYASLSIISKITDKIQIKRLSKIFKSGITWFLGIGLTIFVAVISLEGTLSSGIDGVTAKTTKAVVSSAIPIVGKILGDAVDSVLGCGIILKNAVGIIGVLIIVGICLMPIIRLSLMMISYKVIARDNRTNSR